MNSRRRIFLFLVCAAVLLAAGYGWGYASAQNRYYAPESLLGAELTHLDFNNRLLHYANVNQPGEGRRELTARLREQIAFVENVAPGCADAAARQEAEQSVRNARLVISGQPLSAAASPAAPR